MPEPKDDDAQQAKQEQPKPPLRYPERSSEELRKLGVPVANDLIIHPVPRRS
jgi:hypothetical protein